MPSSRCFCQPGTASQQGLSFQPGAVSSTRLFPAQGLFPARGSFQPRGCFQHWALSSPGFFPAKGLFQPRALSRQRRLPEPGLFPTTGLSKLFWAFSTARSFPTQGRFQPRGLSSQGSFPGLGSSPAMREERMPSHCPASQIQATASHQACGQMLDLRAQKSFNSLLSVNLKSSSALPLQSPIVNSCSSRVLKRHRVTTYYRATLWDCKTLKMTNVQSLFYHVASSAAVSFALQYERSAVWMQD